VISTQHNLPAGKKWGKTKTEIKKNQTKCKAEETKELMRNYRNLEENQGEERLGKKYEEVQ